MKPERAIVRGVVLLAVAGVCFVLGAVGGAAWTGYVTKRHMAEDVAVRANEHLFYLSLLRNGRTEECVEHMEQNLGYLIHDIQTSDAAQNNELAQRQLAWARKYFESLPPGAASTTMPAGLAEVPLPPDMDVSALVGRALPSVETAVLDGPAVRVAALPGVVVLDFWTTWCVNCPIATAALEKTQTWAQAQGTPVTFRSIAVGEEEAKVRAYLGRHPQTVPVCLDREETLARALGVRAYPTILIVKDGVVVGGQVGVTGDLTAWLQGELRKYDATTTPPR